MLNLPVYLDHNATTPCDPRVLESMLPYFTERFGNAASRSHFFGWQAEEAVKLAREQVAALIHALPEEIVFTSGATESVNLAIKGVFEMYAAKGKHVITVVTEHKAVLDTCKHLEKSGADISWLGVDSAGLIDPRELESAIRPDTIMIAIMFANNEIGVLQPIREISRIAKKHGVIFFSDATQAVGKVPVHVDEDGIDLMAFSAHKIYGPKGAGALYVRRRDPRVRLIAQMDGGGHEGGRRSGTLNVPGIVGLGRACVICLQEMERDNHRITVLRNKLEAALLMIAGTQVNGSTLVRLPQLSNISFQGVDDQALMIGLSKEIAVSSGSACTSALPEPSYVLKALGLDDQLANSSLRFGLGKYNSAEEIDFTIDRVTAMVGHLREGNLRI